MQWTLLPFYHQTVVLGLFIQLWKKRRVAAEFLLQKNIGLLEVQSLRLKYWLNEYEILFHLYPPELK